MGNQPSATVPTEFVWREAWGGQKVQVTGDFVEWNGLVQMDRDASKGPDFFAVVPLPPGSYKYKYVVDDIWKVAPDQKALKDPVTGYVTNVVEVPGDKSGKDSDATSPAVAVRARCHDGTCWPRGASHARVSATPASEKGTPESKAVKATRVQYLEGILAALEEFEKAEAQGHVTQLDGQLGGKDEHVVVAKLSKAFPSLMDGLKDEKKHQALQSLMQEAKTLPRSRSRQYIRRPSKLIEELGLDEDKEPPVEAGKVRVTFWWGHGGKELKLSGNWLNWKSFVPMARGSGPYENSFSTRVDLPVGRHMYKFVQDGVWKVAHDQPQCKDSGGFMNNYVDVKEDDLASQSIPYAHLRNPGTESGAWQRPPKENARPPNATHYSFDSFASWRGQSEGMQDLVWQPYLGATRLGDGTFFRVWGPTVTYVEVVVERRNAAVPSPQLVVQPLRRAGNGQFYEGWVGGVGPGDVYRFGLKPCGSEWHSDPASRYQPEGVNGPSMVVDYTAFRWTDHKWKGITMAEASCVYEIHIGTFTEEGTFRSAQDKLVDLKELGVNLIEIMPLADFAGDRNWGYDGTHLFAIPRCYGSVDDLKAFVNEAHRLGIAVVADAVYNHFGPDGDHMKFFANCTTTKMHLPWGPANDLGSDFRYVAIENALMYVHEYHFDGVRLDSTHSLFDDRTTPFLSELGTILHSSVKMSGRQVLIMCEDARNWPILYQPVQQGGYGLDGTWSDDFHYRVTQALEKGEPDHKSQDRAEPKAKVLVDTIRRGWTLARFGHPSSPYNLNDMSRFIYFLDNHDQVGNRPLGDRLSHRLELPKYRAASVMLLALPQTILLFMGQEWACTTPFQFFTDHNKVLGPQISEGRRKEFSTMEGWGDQKLREKIPDPQDPATYENSKLRWSEAESDNHAPIRRLFQAMLALRNNEPAMRCRHRSNFSVECIDNHAIGIMRRPNRATDDAIVTIVVLKHGERSIDLSHRPLTDPLWDGESNWVAKPDIPAHIHHHHHHHRKGAHNDVTKPTVTSRRPSEHDAKLQHDVAAVPMEPPLSYLYPDCTCAPSDCHCEDSWTAAYLLRPASRRWSVELTSQDVTFAVPAEVTCKSGGTAGTVKAPVLTQNGSSVSIKFFGPSAIVLRCKVEVHGDYLSALSRL